MDGLTLLREASAAGLIVRADGERLLIRGPRRAEALVQRLLIHKAAVLTALTATLPPAVPEAPVGHSLTADEAELFVERLAIATVDGRLSEEEAVSWAWVQIQAQRRIVQPLACRGIDFHGGRRSPELSR